MNIICMKNKFLKIFVYENFPNYGSYMKLFGL